MPITGKTNLHLITLHLNNLISKSMFFFFFVFFDSIVFFKFIYVLFQKKNNISGIPTTKGSSRSTTDIQTIA